METGKADKKNLGEASLPMPTEVKKFFCFQCYFLIYFLPPTTTMPLKSLPTRWPDRL